MDSRRLYFGSRSVARGFSLLELVLVVIVLGALIAVLSNRFLMFEEAAEKANVELEISTLKNALRVRMANLLIEGRTEEYVQLARQNPMDWLEVKPANYGGTLPLPSDTMPVPGNWYFEPASATLVYVARHNEHFAPDSRGLKEIRLRTVSHPHVEQRGGSSAESGQAAGSLSMELVEKYSWLEDYSNR